MKIVGKIVSVIIVLLALGGVVIGVLYTKNYMENSKNQTTTKRGARGGGGAGNPDTVYTVRTQIASVSTLNDYVNANGNVEALSSVSVFPNMAGKIVSVSVNLGSHVKKGETIARIDPSVPGVNYALSPVVAPISGTIISTPLNVGTTVSTASPVVIIGDIDRLQITTYIPERYVGFMQTGLQAEVWLEAYPDVTFPASVSYISPVLDTATRTKEIVLRFDRADIRINAGMFAKVKLYTVKHSGHITVPSQAIVSNGDHRYLYIAKGDGTVEQREVIVGNAVDGISQITEGVRQGERIVVEGGTSLFDGAKVNDISND